MKSLLLSILSLLFTLCLHAQAFRVYGKITNNKMEPLAFVSIQIKDHSLGTTTKEDGTFELALENGQYELVISMIGYKSQVLSIAVNKDYQQNIMLEEDDAKTTMDDIVIRVKVKDRAEEIVKNVIRNKDEVMSASGPYSCQLYIKALQQDSSFKKSKKQKNSEFNGSNADLEGMALAEISLHLDHGSDQQIKEERKGVRSSGSSQGLFYLTTTDGNINFYNNLVKVPTISATPFLSPISYSGLMAYKFKTQKIERIGTHKIYTISVKPRQLSNATVEGEMVVSDSTWTLLHTSFSFPKYHMPEYDYFEVQQDYSFVQGKAWMLSHQQFTYFSKGGKKILSGKTDVVYSDYELNKKFPSHYFGAEVSATAQEAYEKDSTFWETVRTRPLTDKEMRFIHFKDSVYRATHTQQYLDSIDRLTNRIDWRKLGFLGQTFYNRKKEQTLLLPSLVSLYHPFEFGGARIAPSIYFNRKLPNRQTLDVRAEISYGVRNNDINGDIRLQHLYNPISRSYYQVEAYRDFSHISGGDAWINMIKRSNYFLNNYFMVGHGFEVVNGLSLYTEAAYSLRRSVAGYETNPKVDSLFGDLLTNNQAIAFEPYDGFYTKVRLQYTPGQKYIREPREKIILGSKWPTFYVTWNKGYPGIWGSKTDFNYLEYGIEQKVNVGLLGIFHYNIKTGNFLNRKDLRIVDYHYQRQGDPMLFLNPDEAFQALDSTFPLFDRFYQAHALHEFNGALLNKIPLLKKLQLHEIVGGGFLIAPERNLRYAELFTGVERVFKWPFDPLSKFKVGFYVVGSTANKFSNPIQFKVGLTTWDRKTNKWK